MIFVTQIVPLARVQMKTLAKAANLGSTYRVPAHALLATKIVPLAQVQIIQHALAAIKVSS